jgi:hypothetical protein
VSGVVAVGVRGFGSGRWAVRSAVVSRGSGMRVNLAGRDAGLSPVGFLGVPVRGMLGVRGAAGAGRPGPEAPPACVGHGGTGERRATALAEAAG